MVQTDWDRMIPALVGGGATRCRLDVGHPERRRWIDFTDRYYKAPVRFVGPAEAGLSDAQEAMAGKAVGVQRGTVNQVFMGAHYPAAPR